MGAHALSLSFNPLFAARMAFRECETFFFGTASTTEGNSSHNDRNGGIDQERGRGDAERMGMNEDARKCLRNVLRDDRERIRVC